MENGQFTQAKGGGKTWIELGQVLYRESSLIMECIEVVETVVQKVSDLITCL